MFKRDTQFNDSKKETKDHLRSGSLMAMKSAQAIGLRDCGDEIPVEPVARLAWEDPSPEVRSRALALLAEPASDTMQASLRLALTHPDPSVRETAEALIADWHIMLDDVPGHPK
jgi:HEAT repeat protein